MTEYRSRFGNKSPTSQPPVKQETSGQMLNDEARKLLEEKSKAAARASLKAAEAGGRKTVEAGKAALEKFKGWRASKAKAGVATDSNVEPPALVEASPPVATIEDLRDGYDQTIAVPMSFSVAMDGQDDRELARGIEQEWDLSRESGVLVQDGKGSLHQDLTHRLDTLVSPESAPLTELSCRDAADALNAEPVESALADFIELGKAAGRLTKKHFPDAPDEGVVLGLTGDDLSKHYLLFGETDSGMTSSAHAPRATEWLAAEQKKNGDLQQKKRWLLLAAGLVAVAFITVTTIYWTSRDAAEPPETQAEEASKPVLAPVAPAPVVVDSPPPLAAPATEPPQEMPQPAVESPIEVAVPKVDQVAPTPVERPAASAAPKPAQARKPTHKPAAAQPSNDNEQEAIDAIREFEKKLGGG